MEPLVLNSTYVTNNSSVMKLIGTTHTGGFIARVVTGGHGGDSFFPGSCPGATYNVDKFGRYCTLGAGELTEVQRALARQLSARDLPKATRS